MTDDKSLSKTYDPAAVEQLIYETWMEADAFHAVPDDRPPEERYVIMMPLPNVTGALHMGHAMDNVMQDLLVRWHRMLGDNTLWMPGTDHAGIATQAVVEKRLKELEGKTRYDLGREGLVERIWQWKDQYQARIIMQQKRMGCSCDWKRQRFTMDAVCARAVRQTFFRMFEEGLIFRGKRLVNWDVFLQTSVSDDEVYHETVKGSFWHLRYPVIHPKAGEPQVVTVATTRPETMLGDTAVAVHPDPAAALEVKIAGVKAMLSQALPKDIEALEAEREALEARQREQLPELVMLRDMARDGRHLRLPLLDRPIPLILDEWAKPELGSGCVKITPAHDPNDYEVWKRHKDEIDILNILERDGTLNETTGAYAGMERYAARKKVVADLDALTLLGEVEDRDVEVGHSDRSKTPVEPYLSDQWFVRMGDVEGGVRMGRGTDKEFSTPGLVQAAMDAVEDGRVKIHPERYTKTYLNWLAEKRDWPVSRQLWWGHQIPVWSKKALWCDLDLSELAPIFAALGERALVRVHVLDSATSLKIEGSMTLSAAEPAPEEPCALDICLLEDDEALVRQLEQLGYVRDPDVLDTWFSSALWPHSTLGWPDPASAPLDDGQAPFVNRDGGDDTLAYYYPGSCLVTARDIITLWVARMVISGLYNVGDIPFSDVFIHANILDGKGERMSKSKGNGIDPVDIIEQYGTDAMRYVLCEMQTGSQDIRLPVIAVCPHCQVENDLAHTKTGKSIFIRVCKGCKGEFDVLGTMPDVPAGKLSSKRFEVGRAFCTKLWNSARFAFINLEGAVAPSAGFSTEKLALEDRWILDQLNEASAAVHKGLCDYNPATAIMAAREFFWGSLCDWYLELIKPRLAQGDAETAQAARRVLSFILDQILRLFQPFMPFITEHLWKRLDELVPDRSLGVEAKLETSHLLVNAQWPQPNGAFSDPELRATFAQLQGLTRAIRDVRAAAGVSPKERLDVTVKPRAGDGGAFSRYGHVVQSMANVGQLKVDAKAERQDGAAVKVVGDLEIFVHGVIDEAAESERLEKELARVKKEVFACEKKLGNAKFVDRAPEAVVAEQRERLARYQGNLEALERTLGELK
ncbi:MAG: valine--tRNA ligase [Deltaproteobacteria bacterium]|nr:valine--tRNA ligase [Deltaproteobacteria bacterium]